MADSKTESDSITASLVNGFDPPDVPSTKVSAENKDWEGDVSDTSKKDAEEKSVEEVKGLVVEEKELEDLKDGVDKNDEVEVKDVDNKKSLEINENFDEKDLGRTKDGEDKKDVGDRKDLESSVYREEKEDACVIEEASKLKDVGETMYLEGFNGAKDTKVGENEKGAGEAKKIDGKSDVGDIMCLEGQKNTKEAKEDDKYRDVVKALDREEEKGIRESKDEEGKKVVEETNHDEDKTVVKEALNAEENYVDEATKDIGCKNNVQASGNVEDNGEKNYVGDAKGTEQKQVIDGNVHEDEKLKFGKKQHVVQGDEQKRDLGGENNVKNDLKLVAGDERVKVRKKSKNIRKVEAKLGKKKVVVDEKVEEMVALRGLEDEKEDVAEEVHVSEEENVTAGEDNEGDIEKISSNQKVAKSLKRKRGKGQRSDNKREVKDKSIAKGKNVSGEKTKESTSATIDAVSSPLGSSRERPVRERKTVERLVEVIEKEPNKSVIIEKGRGTPLKDIPNVAYKLARKKPAELKFLHQILFGRRGKVIDFKSNILQFSGFAWHEAEEKPRAKIKEKLDKCVKDNLLDLCDLLDLTVSKTNTRKEDIIAKLVDLLEAPHATTDVMLTEREQSEKSRKRKRSKGSGSRSSGSTPSKRSRKKSVMAEGTPKSSEKNPKDAEDEEDDTENGVPDEDDVHGHSESDAKENELSDASNDEVEDEDNDEFGKRKKDMGRQSPKKQGSINVEKRRMGSNSKKVSSETQVKSPVKSASSSNKHLKVKKNDTGEKVFTRKKKKTSESPEASDDERENEDVDELGKGNKDIKQSPKLQGSSISKKRKRAGTNSKKASSQTIVKSPVKTPSSYKQAKVDKDDNTGEKVFTRKKKNGDLSKKSNSKSSVKDNSSGKQSSKGKATREERKSGPSKTDLRKTICEVLKEVDFNTATFTDILKKLAAHYKVDLTPKKAQIKQMIQEELTKMAEEAEDSEDEEEKDETGKEENPKPVARK